jgi:hypothetical protein
MDLKEILAISGHSGLFKFVSQSRNGIVVESFLDKKRSFVPASTKVSSLDDIAVYTSDKEIALKEVFKIIFDKETGKKVLDTKTAPPEDLKKYMEEVLPEYDRERVYVSDIKKILSWYNTLQENDLLKFEEEKTEKEEITEKSTEAFEANIAANDKKPAKENSKQAEKKTTQPAKLSGQKAGKKAKEAGKKPVK